MGTLQKLTATGIECFTGREYSSRSVARIPTSAGKGQCTGAGVGVESNYVRFTLFSARLPMVGGPGQTLLGAASGSGVRIFSISP